MYFSQRFPPMKIFDPEFRNIEYSKPARITRSSVTFVIFKNLPYMFKVLVLYGHGATSVTATEKVPINYHIENKVLCMCVCEGGEKTHIPEKDMMRLRALSYLPSIIYYLYLLVSAKNGNHIKILPRCQ